MNHDADLTRVIIESSIEVHKHLGPGLLESAYERCLCHEFEQRRIPYECQKALPVAYKGINLDCSYKIDVVVFDKIVLELKSVDTLLAIHEAQLLTYLKLSGLKTGLLINFNTRLLKDGIKRMVL